MIDYPSPSALIARLRRGGHHADKRLGQHFLADEWLLTRIADLTEADAASLVVEIGPGPGTLTSLLARRAAAVLAIERDARLRTFHEEIFSAGSNVEFLYEDALRVNLGALARRKAEAIGARRLILAGNIPFQITSPLLFGQTGPAQPWERLVLMIQREVADRITASPHSRVYGILTVKLAYWWRVTGKIEIPAEKFFPRPRVNATALRLEPAPPRGESFERSWLDLSNFVDLCFNQRRKKLYNSPAALRGAGKEAFRSALERLGLNPSVRAEDLSPQEFCDLHQLLTPLHARERR